VVKITGKSRKRYKLSITYVEAELNFIIPKTIPLILYPRKFFVSYPLSLELFVHLYLIPKTPNRASVLSSVNYALSLRQRLFLSGLFASLGRISRRGSLGLKEHREENRKSRAWHMEQMEQTCNQLFTTYRLSRRFSSHRI